MVNWTNMTDFASLPAKANETAPFWTGILYMIWIVLIFLMMGFGFDIAILAASFVALVIGMLLAYANLIAWANVGVFAGLLFFMFIYIAYSKK